MFQEDHMRYAIFIKYTPTQFVFWKGVNLGTDRLHMKDFTI